MGVIHRFCRWRAELKVIVECAESKAAALRFWASESFLESTGEIRSVDGGSVYASGPLSSAGGELRFVPLRIWHVGHNLTNRDISSFGTLVEAISIY